jgi:hypothetical protein
MERSIHDNVVYGYLIAPANDNGRTYSITLYTEYPFNERTEYTDIRFRNVLAHYFIGSLCHSILFSIEKQLIQESIQQYKPLFDETKHHGWPPMSVVYSDDTTSAAIEPYSCFTIHTSYGLIEGWIWATGVEIRPRTTRKAFTEE